MQSKNILNKNNDKKFLITGGTGYIGKELISSLENKFNIFHPDKDELNLLNSAIELDIYIKEHNINNIIHLAFPKDFGTNNALGQALIMNKNIIDVCIVNDLKLYFISDKVVFNGYKTNFLELNEKNVPIPKGSYSEAKYLCETMLEYSKIYGLNYAIIRSGSIYGGHNLAKPKIIYNIIDKIVKNENIFLHKYLNDYPAMDLLHIKDFIKAIKLIINNDLNEIVHIGSGKLIYIKDIAEYYIKEVNSKSKINFIRIEDFTANVFLDITKIKNMLNWNPEYDIYDFIKGIKK